VKEVVEWQWGGWFRLDGVARSVAGTKSLVKPVRKRLILMVRATLNRCHLQRGEQQAMSMNIKQFIASKLAHMVCTVH
jgi:hypothetical protein